MSATRAETTTPTIQYFCDESDPAPHPEASVALQDGWKLLCPGALVCSGDNPGRGNMLTACWPSSIFGCAAASKDQDYSDPRAIQSWAYAINDPDDLYDVQVFAAVSGVDPQSHPTVTVTVPDEYTLVGGGAQAHYGGQEGQFLIASRPTDDQKGWIAASIDHLKSDPGTVTAYAIGMRSRAGGLPFTVHVVQQSSPSESHPDADQGFQNPNIVLSGGGAAISQASNGAGNMLTATYPRDETSQPGGDGSLEWHASGQDQSTSDPESITVWAIGIEWGSSPS